MIPKVEPGIYRHYKGKLYLVIGMATHSETNEELVLYIPLYEPLVVPGKHHLVVRPAKMWQEMVAPSDGAVCADSETARARNAVLRFTFVRYA